jgi:hypothetical protein
MAGWMEAARKEVNCAKEIENTSLNRFHGNQISRDNNSYQTRQCSNTTPCTNNSGIVPMEVDATNTTLPFKRLMDKEHAQYCTKGWCFRCCTQGHMAQNCPKNNNLNQTNVNTHKSSITTTTSPPAQTPTVTPTVATPPAPPVPPKLSFTQQICAFEEHMTRGRMWCLP